MTIPPMRLLLTSLRLFPAMLLTAFAAGDGEKDLTAAEFKKLHAEIVPKSKECWEKVPWKIDLFEARALSYRVKKPIFLWAMNGHPLGCT
jgi:hypothetical protein